MYVGMHGTVYVCGYVRYGICMWVCTVRYMYVGMYGICVYGICTYGVRMYVGLYGTVYVCTVYVWMHVRVYGS